MQRMHKISTAKMKERQLPLETKPIYIVDDRINATRKPDDFATRFCEVANAAIGDHSPLFALKTEAELEPGDWVLRIQDYTGEEFDPETGLLQGWVDGKSAFYSRHPDVVKQTLTVNKNSKILQDKAQRKNPRQWTVDEYLDYPVPSVKDLQTDLEVCRNQLLLKDLVQFPENILPRFPQAKQMENIIFLYNQALVYFDGSDLHLMSVANNRDEASEFVQTLTGWDLLDDVLLPSAQKQKFKGMPEPKDIEGATKRPFLITRDFVWEIWEGNGRILNEDPEIQKRLEAFEQSRPIREYYPIPSKHPPFDKAHLQAYQEFLDQEVRQSVISYTQLVKQYGHHIKDESGNVLIEDGGFFNLLGIPNARKFREYLRDYLGIPLESVREDALFPVYKGIWYDPGTNHYVAGVKDPNPEEQERGHALRHIIVHQGTHEPDILHAQLDESFFPLLEVNFIRYRNYTVYPFPIKLIEIWQEIIQNR